MLNHSNHVLVTPGLILAVSSHCAGFNPVGRWINMPKIDPLVKVQDTTGLTQQGLW